MLCSGCVSQFKTLMYKIQIFSHVFAQRRYDIELRKEMSNLKEEMAKLSIMNEFAKYAKLQRKYNQVESILKENSKFISYYINSKFISYYINIVNYFDKIRELNF